MAKKHHLPIRGATSDGLAVTIGERDLGYLTQLAGWESFEKASDDMLRSQALSLPTGFVSPVSNGSATVWRIAPDRLLVQSEAPLGFESSDELVVLDLSEARVILTLEGPGSPGLLSHVVALDFSEAAFPAGTFAQTALHHVGVLVERQEPDRFTVLVPTTWANSMTSLLADHISKAA